MKLTLKVLMFLLVGFNVVRAMESDKADMNRECHPSSLCGDIQLEGGRGTYPEPTEEELKLSQAE